MLFGDGFFHADLHPGNMMFFPDLSIGFIDLGMVGRLDESTRKAMLYYFHSLVMGDPENAARLRDRFERPLSDCRRAGVAQRCAVRH